MHHRHHRLFIHSLTLAGVLGCDAPPGAAPTVREELLEEGELLALSPASCFDDLKLVLHHEDGTTDVSNSLGEGLGALARPNDLVELSFGLDPGCAAEHGSRVSLVSYTTAGITPAVLTKKPLPQAFDMHTAPIGPDGGHLWVRLPPCFFEVDLVFGEPLQRLSSSQNPYEADGRLVVAGHGGHSSCEDVPRLAVERFDPAEQGWGEAPVAAHFGWKLAAAPDTKPSCALDLDGDGQPEQTFDPCPLDTGGIKVAALPSHTFAAVGEHRPALLVSDGERRIWAATSIFANHLEFRPEVRFPEQAKGFVAAVVDPVEPPELATVKLKFAGADDVPSVAPGEVIVGKGGAGGYMVRAVEVVHNGESLVVIGEAVGLEGAIAGGFFGARDVQIDTTNAGCPGGSCSGVLTPVAAPPGAGSGGPVKDALLAAEEDEESKFGVKIAADVQGGLAEVEVFAGVVIERFVLDFGWFGMDAVEVKGKPMAEVAVAVKQEFESDPLELGEFYLGTLPLPVPLSVWLLPKVSFSAALKAALKGSLSAPFEIVKDAAGWRTSVDPQASGDAQGLEPEVGLEVEGEVKATLSLENELRLAFLTGPYAALKGSLGAKATKEFCKGCLTAFIEGGAEVGWHSDVWLGGELFEPQEVTLLEVELLKKCWELPSVPELCEPEPEPPPGGATWGDVHLVSHDGLLFDFQAGGEFVLTRATAGAPFEVQTRQEPADGNLGLSFNTALATVVDGRRVGIYTRRQGGELYIDGTARTLMPGEDEELGSGRIERTDEQTYVIDYPTGDQVVVTRVGAQVVERRHLDIAVRLVGGRAGAVEGLLGDADGDRADDIGLGGGQFMAHPVSFEQLHAKGPGTFDAAWRVDPAASLFDYDGGTSAATFRGEPYILMPTSQVGTNGQYNELAQTACETCPAILRETCLLDVAHSGEVTFADACQSPPAAPLDVLPPSNDPVLVYPNGHAFTDCDDQKMIFRAPGAGHADQYPGGDDFKIEIQGFEAPPFPNFPGSWLHFQTFDTTQAPAGGADWGEQFQCEPLGEGSWGECTLRIEPRGETCADDLWIQHYRWSVKPLTQPGYTIHAYFNAP
ncbi:VWD domain-containing protein [Nannocystis pusilla]|uniref:VWD domain-containing protein n=1 Tax=Nannocystis pusilla TaxID=889268 RepID=A0ABS7TJY4_9BACT|nr:VWD domain-containing protein [Nannocystis pusilla]MBZ5708537.1 VWD domain-containing protein [Nannocystis pusilla]